MRMRMRRRLCTPALVTGGVLDPESKSITWGSPATCWLPGDTVAAFKDLIKGRGSTVAMEVARYVKPEIGATLHDPSHAANRLISLVSLDQLLNPGAVVASGNPLLKPPLNLGGGAQNSCLPVAPAEAPEGTKSIEEEPLPEGVTNAWTTTETPPSATFTLTLSKPLLAPFKPPAPTEMSVADLLPKREPLAPIAAPNTATEAFRAEVLSAAGTLSKEYAGMFTGEPLDDGGKQLRRKGLVFELNRSGKYHAMKERLKEAAQAIIKERFFEGGEGVQGKYNELYVHLVDEMHAALRALGAPPSAAAAAADGADAADGVDHDKLARYKAGESVGVSRSFTHPHNT